ncbi:rho GTPase-activating protein 1-like [Oppia nitens]|uniref:rho GTPase-activating protein 1-like n=1 Tax=Oppia nitens TaxID=1686743 RepID=UPI0023DA317E|nr:rho GTPase-activating protein 1-like [Oppia nitens]
MDRKSKKDFCDIPEDVFPSLDHCGDQDVDLEPGLEFDDSELTADIEPNVSTEEIVFFESNDDFESELTKQDDDVSDDDDFDDVRRLGIVDVLGDDRCARKVICVYACRLPDARAMSAGRVLRFLLLTLDAFVESDYSLVYFHFGLNARNRPTIRWFWNAFRAFDRKYRKNLKALFLVHPTPFLRLILRVFRPVVSAKFGRKVRHIMRLHELEEEFHVNQLSIPDQVKAHDRRLGSSVERKPVSYPSLSEMSRESGDSIPKVIRFCISFLSNENSLQIEGLFRRSASATTVQLLRQRALNGQPLWTDGSTETREEAVHAVAALLKASLRELPEPLLTFQVFDDVIDWPQLPDDATRVAVARAIVQRRLPEENFEVLAFLTAFLAKVEDRSHLNKMTAANLAIVFGPNLLWSRDGADSLRTVCAVNAFTEFLLRARHSVFDK